MRRWLVAAALVLAAAGVVAPAVRPAEVGWQQQPAVSVAAQPSEVGWQ